MICEHCLNYVSKVVIHKGELICWPCLNVVKGPVNSSTGVITDEIPGGYSVAHAICNPDGTPRRFYSKSEIKRAAHEAGWTISGDTPKPNQRIVEANLAR